VRRTLIAIAIAGTLLWTAIGAALLWPDRAADPNEGEEGDEVTATVVSTSGDRRDSSDGASNPDRAPLPSEKAQGLSSRPAAEPPEPIVDSVQVRLKDPPRAGALFDVESGEILWAIHPDVQLPIASLTKMMTGLLIAERHADSERVLITREAVAFRGSGVGTLPPGKKVKLGILLAGLMLVSGNDAAIALAQHDAHTVQRFVARMNARATEMGLGCTHFTTPHGLKNPGNYSCARDLAALATADLANGRIAKLAGTEKARFPFPIKGGHLDLSNNNPFVQRGDHGITGLKTGYTHAAGRCYVVTQRRGGRHLGVVLLGSPDPLHQVSKVLRRGFGDSPKPATG
jgi:D-alanyl-D-alanine carboxypeptidase (penicillin-binding protein 5/6)